ncbi:ATP-dependent RNA helicase DDX1-like [Tubulanus polymorphus]|uniref:ATP-dependent RNA helicase DDX1-like n=1 Tax=Tubulanus polymorphus TaxID=672921 RepID=UPI003DA6B9BD
MTAFEEMGVMPEIGRAVEEMDWSLPTDVQAEAIPMILGGGDVLMAAETGSGKTGAFCLPIIQIVYETMRDLQDGKGKQSQGGGAKSKKWKMNVFDRGDAMAIDADGLLCQSRDAMGWHGTRSTKAVTNKGKYYFEGTVTDEGLCRVGWSTNKARLDLGTDKEGYGFGGTGKKSFAKQFDTYGEPYAMNDTIGCFLDLDLMTVKWSKNGVEFEKAYDIPHHLRNSAFHAAVVLKNAEMKFNFGESPFKHPPASYTPLCKAPKECTTDSPFGAGTAAVSKGPAPNAPYAIIIEPSRELAEQTHVQVQKFKKHLDRKISDLLCIGGIAAKDQIAALKNGVEIVCGTPGRLEDLISTESLLLSNVRFFVLDEADGLLSAGYGELINRIHKQIPKVTNDGKRLQMIVCSATLHSFDVKKMAERLMYFPTWIDLKGQDSVPETVHHVVCQIDPTKDTSWKTLNKHVCTDGVHESDNLNPGNYTQEMLSEAVKMLKGEYLLRCIKEHKIEKSLIFCRTKLDCDNLEKYFIQLGGGPKGRNKDLSCVCLHGDRRPPERKANLERFKKNEVRFMICTDVAARGIDVSGLPFVINVTMPDEKQNYVHRIGRVGRADRMGLAISLVSACKEKVWYHSNCSNRGKGCYNTRLTDQGGCCIWYNEPQLLNDVEDHLGVTIDQVQADFKIPVNEFDGKVTYGTKRVDTGSGYKGHVEMLAPTVAELATLESRAQISFLNLKYKKSFGNTK